MSDHADFNAAFPGGKFRFRDLLVEVTPHRLGRLTVRSGRITACDPLAAFDLEPLGRKVPNGSFEVWAAVASFGEDQRVAAALLRFAPGEPVRWEMATREGQKLKDLPAGNLFGYGVDAGTGCFADAEAAKTLADDRVSERLQTALEETYVHTWSSAILPGIAAFSSGWGDGFYASYWGFDAKGKLLALATDFGVLLEPVEEIVFLDPRGPFEDPKLAKAGVSIRSAKSARNGVSLEITSPRSLDLEPIESDGSHAPIAYSMSSQAGVSTYDFDPMVAGQKLRVKILLGLKPLARA